MSRSDKTILTKIINEEPLPIPSSVINSINYIMIIDPTVNINEISRILLIKKKKIDGLIKNVKSKL